MLQAGRSRVRIEIGVIGFLSGPNPSSLTVTLGSSEPVTEMSTRNFPGVKGWAAGE
jgi:hypothetical protein